LKTKDRIVIVGATSAMAEQCARLWVQEQPVDLVLVGRNAKRIERIAIDLRVRSPNSEVTVIETDFLATEAIQATVDSIESSGQVNIVLIAHGSLPEQVDCQNNLNTCREALEINGISPVLWAEAFAMHMTKANTGTIALIGSVAGDRGRKSNYTYGSAKGLVTRYAQGMQHRFAGTGVKVVLIKPGPTATPMTAHLTASGARMASVKDVAKDITSAIRTGKSTAYSPGKWEIIMMIIRHLPGFIFNKINI
jgi:short-subunit dehydrogenase